MNGNGIQDPNEVQNLEVVNGAGVPTTRVVDKATGIISFDCTLGGKVYQVLKTGAAIEQFRFTPEDTLRTSVYRVTIAPFHRQGTANAALLVVEDLTQSELLQKLELEASSLRLVKTMADRLAH